MLVEILLKELFPAPLTSQLSEIALHGVLLVLLVRYFLLAPSFMIKAAQNNSRQKRIYKRKGRLPKFSLTFGTFCSI